MKVRVLSAEVIAGLLDFGEAIDYVERGYVALFEGRVQTPPIQHLENPEVHGEIDVKSAVMRGSTPYVTVKAACGFYDNPARGLPTGSAMVLLLDGSTGFPLALMDGWLLTSWRTGAAAGVATRLLARADATSLGLVGCGEIAAMAARAVARVRPLDRVTVWAPPADRDLCRRFAETIGEELGVEVAVAESVADAVGQADVVVTATPSREALVMLDMVRPGTHITAIGADGPGKQELEARLTARSRLFVDLVSQCRTAGELQHPLREGLMSEADVHAEIGAVLAGAATGRENDDEITVFDSTGTAAQDIVLATLAYERALATDAGSEVELA